jgi:predicted ATPase
MMIQRLWAKNFLSLANVNVELEPITVLVGRNAAGKSNFVDVLRFISEAIQLGLDTAVSRRKGIGAIRRLPRAGESGEQDIELGLEFHLGTLSGSYAFSLSDEVEQDNGQQRRGRHRIKRELCHLHRPGNEKEVIGFEINEGQWVKRPQEMAPPIQPGSLILPLLSGIAPYEQLYNYLVGMSFYTGFLAESIRRPQKADSGYPLAEHGENLASALRQLQKNQNPLFLRALQAAIPEITSYKVAPIEGYLIVGLNHQTSEQNGEQVFGLSDESDGTLRLLTILAALNQEPPRNLIVIEEPELHIHPGALAILWEEFEAAAARSQIILTTHSPDLLDFCRAEQLRVVEKIEGITQVGPIEEAQKRMIQKRLIAPGQLLQAEGLHRATA